MWNDITINFENASPLGIFRNSYGAGERDYLMAGPYYSLSRGTYLLLT